MFPAPIPSPSAITPSLAATWTATPAPTAGLHRFYDPANGRWLNRGPIGYAGRTNLYGYCGGGPVGAADASGFGISSIDATPANAAEAAEDIAIADGCDNAAALRAALKPGGPAVGTGAAALTGDADAPGQAEGAVCSLGQEAYSWIERTAEQHPKLANKFNLHHLIPKYQGGPEDGPLARLPASAHQVITNAFRTRAAYGKGLMDTDKFNASLDETYNEFPFPPEWFQIHCEVP